MVNIIRNKLSDLRSEIAYKVSLIKHAKNLPSLDPFEQSIVDTLKREGVCVTSLENLGLTSTSQLLDAAKSQLANMEANISNGKDTSSQSAANLPKIYTVTDLAEFSTWAREERLVKIIENYVGLPIAFQGVHLRKDITNKTQVGPQLWHKDSEDRRILKIIVYLNDVSEKTGPFEYLPKSVASIFRLAYWRMYYQIMKTGFVGISDEELTKIFPKSTWKSCPGPAGTVVFVDTKAVFHHGTLRTEERSALFFVYTAKHPKRPELCTQYSDRTYARPDFVRI